MGDEFSLWYQGSQSEAMYRYLHYAVPVILYGSLSSVNTGTLIKVRLRVHRNSVISSCLVVLVGVLLLWFQGARDGEWRWLDWAVLGLLVTAATLAFWVGRQVAVRDGPELLGVLGRALDIGTPTEVEMEFRE